MSADANAANGLHDDDDHATAADVAEQLHNAVLDDLRQPVEVLDAPAGGARVELLLLLLDEHANQRLNERLQHRTDALVLQAVGGEAVGGEALGDLAQNGIITNRLDQPDQAVSGGLVGAQRQLAALDVLPQVLNEELCRTNEYEKVITVSLAHLDKPLSVGS